MVFFKSRDTALYALGVGACADDAVNDKELKYVYHHDGQQSIQVNYYNLVRGNEWSHKPFMDKSLDFSGFIEFGSFLTSHLFMLFIFIYFILKIIDVDDSQF